MRLVVIVALFALVTLPLMPLQWLFIRLNSPLKRSFPMVYHRILCRWLGIRISVTGKPARGTGILFLSNHTSYFDILIMSTVIPERRRSLRGRVLSPG